MKKILSFLLMLSILASMPLAAGAADISADKCYPDTDVPMFENVLFVNYVSTETKFEASETVSKYYYDITYPYEDKMANYKGYLLYNGFTETEAGLTKGRFTVAMSKVAKASGKEFMLITVTAGLSDEDMLFDAVNYNPGSNIRVYVNNKELQFAVPPQNINGTVLVPFRAIFEALGLTVGWDAENRTATGKNDKYEISVPIGTGKALVNGAEKTMLQPAQLINGNTMVPVRFISEAAGYNVVWVGDSKNILVSGKNIIEWRYGGHKSQAPYQNFDSRYVNGEKTEAVRYLDTYWTPAQNTGAVDVSSMTEDEYKAKCKAIPYQDLLRQPSYYQNNDVHYRGRVIDVFEIDSYFATTVLIVQVTKLNFAYTDNIYVILPYTTSYLAYDIVDVYGKSMGTTEYNGETIPYISSAYTSMADLTVDTDKTIYYPNTNIPMLENVTGLRYDHKDGNKFYYCYYDMPYGFRSDYMSLLEKNGFAITSQLELDDALIYKKGKQQVIMQTKEIGSVRYFIVTASN